MITVHCVLPIHCGIHHDHFAKCLASVEKLVIPKKTIFHLCICVDGNLSAKTLSDISTFTNEVNIWCSVFFNSRSKGLAGNLNNVITKLNLGTNEFIMRMDADDIMHPLRLEKQLSFLRRNLSIDVVGTLALRIDEAGNVLGQHGSYTAQVYPSHIEKNPIIHPTALIRGDFFAKYGLYDETFKYAQDWELWSRACRQGAKFFVLSETLLKFRFQTASIKKRKLTQPYVRRLAWNNMHNRPLTMLILLRSLVIIATPTYVIKMFLLLANILKKWRG